MRKIRVLIWNEFRHEIEDEDVKKIYPDGIHKAIQNFLSECDDLEVRTATMDEPQNGIPDEVLDNTDVLFWWGHCFHHLVADDRVEYIKKRVLMDGMGFVACHSAHYSKPFRALVGTSGLLSWGDDCREIIWNLKPSHPIAAGIPENFDLGIEEMYGEPFYIPEPDALVFGAWYESGHIFRAGCTFTRGNGKIFYFQPGHELCRSFYNPNVQRILKNAAHWAAPADFGFEQRNDCPYVKPVVKK